MSDTVRLSKFLSLVLRHQPEKVGITLDASGWVDVETLLRGCEAAGVSIARPLLERIVAESDKQRFAFSEDRRRIRANQGHSIEVDLAYEAIVPLVRDVMRIEDGFQRLSSTLGVGSSG